MSQHLRFSGLMVLLSSFVFVLLAFVLQAEASWILDDWRLRTSLYHWLDTADLLWLTRSRGVQVFLFVLALVCGGLGIHSLLKSSAQDSDEEAKRKSQRWVFGIAALVLVMQLCIPPCWSSDVFLYGLHGRLHKVHKGNPLTESGADYSPVCVDAKATWKIQKPGFRCSKNQDCDSGDECVTDFYVQRLKWSQHPSVYGPVAVGLFSAAFDPELDPHENALLFRIWSALCVLLAMAWIMRLWGVRAAALFGWSPVVWLASANGGHLEPFLALGALGLVSVVQTRHRLSSILLGSVLAVFSLIKLPFMGLGAPFFVLQFRQSTHRAKIQLIGSLCVVLALGYWMFWDQAPPIAGLLSESTKTMRTLLHALRMALRSATEYDPIQFIRWGALLGFGVWALFRLRAVRCKESACTTALLIWLLASAIVLGVFHPWHLVPAWALAVGLKYEGRLFKAWLYLAQTSPLWIFGGWVSLGVTAFAPLQSSFIALVLFLPPILMVFYGQERKEEL